MSLCDAGPLVAIVDRSDAYHTQCVTALAHMPPVPLVTTWPCLTEAMYFLGRRGGAAAQDGLWKFLERGVVVLHLPGAGEWQRMRTLMTDYRDAPMDLADASLVTAAENLGMRHIFTVDSHFRVYRIEGRYPFEIVP